MDGFLEDANRLSLLLYYLRDASSMIQAITAHDHEETASHEIDDGSDIGLEKRLLSQLMNEFLAGKNLFIILANSYPPGIFHPAVTTAL